MMPRAFMALSVCAFVYVLSGQTTQAGWSDGVALNRAGNTSSLVISIKKHKNNDDSDDDNHHSKHKDGKDTSERDQGPKDTNSATTPPTNNTNQNVLWGDYNMCRRNKMLEWTT